MGFKTIAIVGLATVVGIVGWAFNDALQGIPSTSVEPVVLDEGPDGKAGDRRDEGGSPGGSTRSQHGGADGDAKGSGSASHTGAASASVPAPAAPSGGDNDGLGGEAGMESDAAEGDEVETDDLELEVEIDAGGDDNDEVETDDLELEADGTGETDD